MPPPDLSARVAIFSVHTRAMPLAPDVCLESLAQLTVGWTGARIAAICREAALAALEDSLDAISVSQQHFLKAVHYVHFM